ncbi:MAG: hypothetical protein FIB04_04875 [Gammaproteobacteria bacterium]|nr:hypothetical protein [Gammaproteobacteria bacterium]
MRDVPLKTGIRPIRPLLAAAAACAFIALPAGAADPQSPAAPATPQAGAPATPPMKPLGNERYQVGKIVVDRKAKRLTLPARVHIVDRPLEYLLTTTGGMKEYESLLEADVSGTEFNLACILLGLERDKSVEPYQQFSQKRLAGPRVDISITRKDEGKAVTVTAADALFDAGQKVPEPVEWVYMGSQKYWQDNRFAADVTGTLVGFVHDPNSVIEATSGLGIGAYGSVNGNAQLLPPIGSEVELSISVPDAGTEKKK